MKGISGFPIVRESVSEHEGIPACQLIIDFQRSFRFGAGYGEAAGIQLTCRENWESTVREDAVHCSGDGPIEKRLLQPASMLLFETRVVKDSVFQYGSTDRRS